MKMISDCSPIGLYNCSIERIHKNGDLDENTKDCCSGNKLVV